MNIIINWIILSGIILIWVVGSRSKKRGNVILLQEEIDTKSVGTEITEQ